MIDAPIKQRPNRVAGIRPSLDPDEQGHFLTLVWGYIRMVYAL